MIMTVEQLESRNITPLQELCANRNEKAESAFEAEKKEFLKAASKPNSKTIFFRNFVMVDDKCFNINPEIAKNLR